MFSKLLLVLGVAFGYGTNLTLNVSDKVSHTPNYSYRYDFIDYESPAYRLGDYEITNIEHISSGGGQVRFNRIQAIIPRVVFETLGEFENVFISMPLYDYNSAVSLYMRIDYNDDDSLDSVMSDLEIIPLSMSMLNILPYTVVDLADNFNVFDSNNWDYAYQLELRLSFVVPFTAHTDPPSDYAQQLRNITLFTKRSVGEPSYYDSGYSDGYGDGYDDGYRDGDEWGYQDGYRDGKDDGYDIGFADAEAIADGSWLGNLVFGTIGGIVGFLFALSDFEVLGVSIMSIITLFVAIGIVRLLLKVLR